MQEGVDQLGETPSKKRKTGTDERSGQKATIDLD